MSSIRQYQRRAAESVITKGILRVRHSPNKLFLGDNGTRRLYLLGISDGVGTCSDMQGVDIAIFSETPFDSKRHHLIAIPRTCYGAVLLRNPTRREINKHRHEFATQDQCLQAVEGLELIPSKHEKIIRFKSNSRTALYVALA